MLVDQDFTYANSAAQNTAKTVAIPGESTANLFVIVKNPGASALTVKVQIGWLDGSTQRWATLKSLAVTANNGDGEAFQVAGAGLESGAQLVVTNDTAIGGSGGFTGHVQARG